ncbi:hypothetical protein [Rhodopila sp.]|jgi:hypothetical protein|uniref:hypothetical protein n=1 Tax=Rhodopila sp. TaxID=2480087 RepID=UPI002CCD030D|nr:hypothetical protein [Rhodopila sp.]HVZ08868.1 hypothetical protein [Rhodopila sp.]
MTEAIRIPSAGAVFWAEAMPDGSSAVRAIAGPPPNLKVTLTDPLPSGISARIGSRGIVLLASAIVYDHVPTQADLASVPSLPAVTVAGSAEPLDGRFHPRQFRVTPTPAAPTYLPLRPSLQATRIGEAGAVVLTVTWQGGGPASWCVLKLSCTRNATTFGFSGQADRNGDVIIPLTGLPPLAPAQTQDSMTLTALGLAAQSDQPLADPDALAAVQVSTGGAFATQQTLSITRGRITDAAALGIAGVTLQPV